MKYELNNLYNADCMEAMKDIPDKHFELAIVDPPYGGGCNAEVGGRFARYEQVAKEESLPFRRHL